MDLSYLFYEVFMKFFLITLSLISTTSFASTCETLLKERVAKDSNIRIVKSLDSYSCGENACAITFEHDSSPYPNLKILAFLDAKNNIAVNWVPVANLVGHESQSKNKVAYIDLKSVSQDEIKLDASVETARDALFKLRRRVYIRESLSCKKN